MARLLVFRACFEMFIDSFTTYRPLLSRIKQEYDLVLESLDSQIHQMTPMEAQLKTIREEYERRMTRMTTENGDLKKQLLEEKDRSRGLEALIDEVRSELLDTKQKLFDLEKEFEESAENARDLEGRMRTLQAEFNEVSAELREVHMRHEEKASELEKSRKQIDEMVPREHVENLANDIIRLRAELTIKVNECKDLHVALADAQQSREEQKSRISDLETNYTPRPDWNQALQFLSDSTISGKRTVDMFNEFCQIATTMNNDFTALKERYIEVTAENRPQQQTRERTTKPKGEDYLVGLGTGNEIPKYLRFKGKVRNRHMTKLQIETFIKEIMTLRQSAVPEDLALPFPEFMYLHLHKKFGIQSMVAEWGYSLLDALHRHDYDSDCEIFNMILSGQVGEDVFFDQIRVVDKVHKTFAKHDFDSNGGKPTGILSKTDVRQLLRKLFPLKSDEEYTMLYKALDGENPTTSVEYDRLFIEGRESEQVTFVEELRDQHFKERNVYIKELEDAVREVSVEDVISLQAAKQAIISIDPKKPKAEVSEYISRAFQLDEVSKESENITISVDDFMKNLRMGVLRRSARKEGPSRRKKQISVSKGSATPSDAISPSPNTSVYAETPHSIREDPPSP
eukprot:TRINITY_DN6482_c0_g1_i5.p1 TRINITY_DN6482_c0_g1~~TRINITY_DN6482_c0_g1_i5.p1  ORF type:complete len:626 (+),score=140.88 TRINITY_DN6482_c0_g1_i5:1094-2971(+)